MNLRQLTPFRTGTTTLAPGQMGPFGFLQREVDRLFDEFARGLPRLAGEEGVVNLVPSIDVSEDDKQIEVAVELPGLERKDVDITLQDDVLVIRGEKKTEAQHDDGKDKQGDKGDKSKSYQVVERSYGMFYRALQLPPGIDPSKIQATMSKGVLKVTIPKPAQSQAKKIEVEEAA